MTTILPATQTDSISETADLRRVDYIRTGCPANEILWDAETGARVREMLIRAIGRDCICQPGEHCVMAEKAADGLRDKISAVTETVVEHTPWCTAHVHHWPEAGQGWCATATGTHGVRVEIDSDVDTLDGAPGIEVYAPGERYLTAAQVREVAAALLKAADILEQA